MFRFRTHAVVATLTIAFAAPFAQDNQHKAHNSAGAASTAIPGPAPPPAAGK